MGDISVIARQLSDKYVQYGWCGNAGYPETVGARLWKYYNTSEMVEYLFGLGQLRQLCAPGGETSNDTLGLKFQLHREHTILFLLMLWSKHSR